MAILTLAPQTFAPATNTPIPVLVDFWAEWCAPCKMILPILEELSTEIQNDVIIAKVNVDDNPELAEGITSIPTMRVYVNGEIVKEFTGAKTKPALLAELKEFLSENSNV